MIRKSILPPGTFHIDRAGYDRVESSALSFELTAELLVAVIAALLRSEDVEPIVRREIAMW
jgi:hypothetical protein